MSKTVVGTIVIGMKKQLVRNAQGNPGGKWVFSPVRGVISAPDRIVAAKNDKVIWAVVNTWTAGVKVELGGFSKTDSSGNVTYLNITPNDVNPGPDDTKIIKVTIPQGAADGTYTYGILVDDQPAWDPELQIEN